MKNLSERRHIHLDPVGGIAGDMFIAAMLDVFPQALDTCLADLDACGVLAHVDVTLEPGKSHGLAVQRFVVTAKGDNPRATGHYSDLKKMLQDSALDESVLSRSLVLLELLASAESKVHGVALDNVHFHEVADWDSIADIVAAASVIERNHIGSWSCGRLPVGSGLVKTEHGMLPVPAPATQVLLEGLTTWDDGEPGERVTPTGAAIVKYLHSFFDNATGHDATNFHRRPSGVGLSSGMGAGQRKLVDRPNVVRCHLMEVDLAQSAQAHSEASLPVLDTHLFDHEVDHVAQLSFGIDDMTSEELAVALQYIRQSDGVIDISHSTSFGKKGRMVFDVNVLCQPSMEPLISRLCFAETSTLGMRVQWLTRRVLKRQLLQVDDAEGCGGGVKIVQRPHASNNELHGTLKVESDDLRRVPGLHSRRIRAARIAKLSGNVQSNAMGDAAGDTLRDELSNSQSNKSDANATNPVAKKTNQ